LARGFTKLTILISARGWVEHGAMVRPEGLSQKRIPITPSGIETLTFWIVAQCLNQPLQRLRSSIHPVRAERDVRYVDSWILIVSTQLRSPHQSIQEMKWIRQILVLPEVALLAAKKSHVLCSARLHYSSLSVRRTHWQL